MHTAERKASAAVVSYKAVENDIERIDNIFVNITIFKESITLKE